MARREMCRGQRKWEWKECWKVSQDATANETRLMSKKNWEEDERYRVKIIVEAQKQK